MGDVAVATVGSSDKLHRDGGDRRDLLPDELQWVDLPGHEAERGGKPPDESVGSGPIEVDVRDEG